MSSGFKLAVTLKPKKECWEGITAQLEEIIKNHQETDVVTGEKKVTEEVK